MNDQTDIVHVEATRVDALAIAKGEPLTITPMDGLPVELTVGTVRHMVPGAKLLNDFQLAGFLIFCYAFGENPLTGRVHIIWYGKEEDPPKYILSYMTYHDRAQRNPHYDGFESGIIWRVDEKIIRGQACDYFLDWDKVHIHGAWMKVYRKDRRIPVEVEVPWAEAYQRKFDGTPKALWGTSPITMVRKVAESQGLRKAFPKELGGTYCEVENIRPPEHSEMARHILPRDDRTTEPPPPAQEPVKTPPQVLAQLVNNAMRERFGADPETPIDRKVTFHVMVRLASAMTGRDPEDIDGADVWTGEFCADCCGYLADNGLHDDWLFEADGPKYGKESTDGQEDLDGPADGAPGTEEAADRHRQDDAGESPEVPAGVHSGPDGAPGPDGLANNGAG